MVKNAERKCTYLLVPFVQPLDLSSAQSLRCPRKVVHHLGNKTFSIDALEEFSELPKQLSK